MPYVQRFPYIQGMLHEPLLDCLDNDNTNVEPYCYWTGRYENILDKQQISLCRFFDITCFYVLLSSSSIAEIYHY